MRNKTLSRQYRSNGKTCDNHGGWRCPCCNPYGCSPRKMKPLDHRRVRRTAKLRPISVLVQDDIH